MEYGLNSWIDYTVIGVYFVFVVTVGLVVSTGGAIVCSLFVCFSSHHNK